MKPVPLPEASELWSRFSVDLWTGQFLHNATGPGKRKTVGCVRNGYRIITVQGRSYTATRLLWKWFYGVDPSGVVDHVGQELATSKSDCIFGLEDVTDRENVARGFRTRGRTLPTGVRQVSSRYYVYATVGTRKVYLGAYDTVEEAGEAYQNFVLKKV